MAAYVPIQIRGFYRSHSHLPIWEVLDKAGIWEQVGIEAIKFEYCADPPDAEAALFDGSIDFVSGNHITPYALVEQGKSIVCLASPVNGTGDRLISREPMQSLTDLRGKRLMDRPFHSRSAGFHHPTGNHILYVLQSGLAMKDVEWVELDEDEFPDYRKAQFDMLKSGKADATFSLGGTEEFEKAGFHILQLDVLPMINGPTLTTTIDRCNRGDQFGERLVKAMVLGIHFAKTHREETELILEGLRKSNSEVGNASYQSLARMPAKPYPDPVGIQNAYELCKLQQPNAKLGSAMALWDLHYLRELDNSGFIDSLYQAGA